MPVKRKPNHLRTRPLRKATRVRNLKKGHPGALGRIMKYFPKVTTVSDERRKRVTVTVTAADTRGGTKGNFTSCALAQACKRQLKVDGAIIGLTFSYLIKGNHATRYRTPTSVAREMVVFDRHKDFDDGKYFLAPVPNSQRLGVRAGPAGSGPRQNKRPHIIVHQTGRVRRSF